MTPLLYIPFPHPFWVRMFLFAQHGNQIWTSINKKEGFIIKLLLRFMESMDRNTIGTKYGWRLSNFRPLLSLLSTAFCIMPSFFCLFVERLLFIMRGEKVWLPTASEYYIFHLLSLGSDWLLFIGFCLKIPRDQNQWAPLGSHVLHFGNKLRTVSRGSFYKHGSSHGHSFWESGTHLTSNRCPVSFSQLPPANSNVSFMFLPFSFHWMIRFTVLFRIGLETRQRWL